MTVPSHSKTQKTLAISTHRKKYAGPWGSSSHWSSEIRNQVRNHIHQVFVYDLSYTELICWVWFIISMILSESLCQNSPRSLSLPSVILSLLDRGLAAPASLVVLVSTIAANSHGANLEGLAVGSKLLWYLQFAHWVVTSLLKSFSSGHLSKWPDSKSYFFLRTSQNPSQITTKKPYWILFHGILDG